MTAQIGTPTASTGGSFVTTITNGLNTAAQNTKAAALWLGHKISVLYSQYLVPAALKVYASGLSAFNSAADYTSKSKPANFGIGAFLVLSAILAGKEAWDTKGFGSKLAWMSFSIAMLVGGGFFFARGNNIPALAAAPATA